MLFLLFIYESSCPIIDITIGSIIITVAVLEIHIERKNEDAIKPRRIRAGLTPVKARMLRAMRLCKFHLSIARATRNPPINRKMTSLKYVADTAFPSIIPNSGKRATGNREVIARGTISVIHQTAISSAMQNVAVTLGFAASSSTKNINQIITRGVIIKLIICFNFIISYLLCFVIFSAESR